MTTQEIVLALIEDKKNFSPEKSLENGGISYSERTKRDNIFISQLVELGADKKECKKLCKAIWKSLERDGSNNSYTVKNGALYFNSAPLASDSALRRCKWRNSNSSEFEYMYILPAIS